MQVFLQIVAFSLQTDWSGQPVLSKGKCPLKNFREIAWFFIYTKLRARSIDPIPEKKYVE